MTQKEIEIIDKSYLIFGASKSSKRERKLVDARKAISYAMYYNMGYRHSYIAQCVGKDRSTIIYYIEKARDLIDVCPDFKTKTEQLIKFIDGKKIH